MPKTTTATWMLAAAALVLATACNRSDVPANGAPPSDAAPPLAPTAPAAGPALPATGVPQAVPSGERHSRLHLVNNSGKLHYSGTVDSAASRQAIIDALAAAYGERDLGGSLKLDDRLQPPGWLGNLPLLLATFSMPGAALGFGGDRIELGGYASMESREALLDRVRVLYPDYRYTGLFEGVGADAAMDDSSRALAALASGGSGTELLAALNEARFHFEEDSARIDPGSLDLVSRAAGAIRAAPEGTRIGISAAALPASRIPALAALAGNAQAADEVDIDPTLLARQRAEAMKVQLILHGVSPAAIETLAAADAGDGDASGPALRFRLLD